MRVTVHLHSMLAKERVYSGDGIMNVGMSSSAVFGPRKAGKSTMLNLLIGRPFLEEYIPTTQKRVAANVIDLPGQTEKILVMTEIPPDEVSTQLMNQFLEKCDVAIFVYDSSDEFSWMQVLDIYWKVSRLAENNGFNLQYLFVAAKSDLEQKKFIQEDSSRVCNHMNLRPPMFVNHKLRGRTVFQIILLAAQRPDRNILSRKAKWINFVLYSFSAVGVTMLGGLAAIHLRKNKNMKERRQNQKLSHT